MLQALPQQLQPVLSDMEANAKVRHDTNAVHADPRSSVTQAEAKAGRQQSQNQEPQQLAATAADGCSAPAPGLKAECRLQQTQVSKPQQQRAISPSQYETLLWGYYRHCFYRVELTSFGLGC